jgi:uncharacterized protein
MSLKNKLARLKPHLSINVEEKKPLQEPEKMNVPFLEAWEKDNVKPYFLDQDYCLIREVSFPLSQKHGHYCFRDFLKAVEIWNDQPLSHPLSAAGHKPEELFFFDTETTGLGGGTGNTIFLLGYASVSGDKLILRQHILSNPGSEVPLYQSFLENVNYKTLVTYNGKSFDWPQVKTRHMLVKDHVPKLPPFGHFDLYHAARRLWKHKLDRLKLAVVEKEVLGVERIDDIPGYLAPMIYFDFVESRKPEGMLGILKHNEVDILSLVTLYTHLTFQIVGRDLLQTRKESYEVGRWFASLGEKKEAEKLFTTLAEGTDPTSCRAKLALGYQSKQAHRWEEALSFFIEAANSDDPDLLIEACVEASKIFEHRKKNIEKAAAYCARALRASGHTKMKQVKERSRAQLEKRNQRLQKKLGKFPG